MLVIHNFTNFFVVNGNSTYYIRNMIVNINDSVQINAARRLIGETISRARRDQVIGRNLAAHNFCDAIGVTAQTEDDSAQVALVVLA